MVKISFLKRSQATQNLTVSCNIYKINSKFRNLLPKPENKYPLPIILLVSHCYSSTRVMQDKTSRFASFSFAQIAALIQNLAFCSTNPLRGEVLASTAIAAPTPTFHPNSSSNNSMQSKNKSTKRYIMHASILPCNPQLKLLQNAKHIGIYDATKVDFNYASSASKWKESYQIKYVESLQPYQKYNQAQINQRSIEILQRNQFIQFQTKLSHKKKNKQSLCAHKKSLNPNYFNTLYSKNNEQTKLEDEKKYDITQSDSDSDQDCQKSKSHRNNKKLIQLSQQYGKDQIQKSSTYVNLRVQNIETKRSVQRYSNAFIKKMRQNKYQSLFNSKQDELYFQQDFKSDEDYIKHKFIIIQGHFFTKRVLDKAQCVIGAKSFVEVMGELKSAKKSNQLLPSLGSYFRD